MTLKSILFCCNHNSSRSVIAENIVRDWYGDTIKTCSAGVYANEPVNGFAIQVMKEINIDIQHHEVKEIKELGETPFELVIPLTDASYLAVKELPWVNDALIEHWNLPNPVNEKLSQAQQLEEFRKIRDHIIKLILVRFPLPTENDDPVLLKDYFGDLN